jgi:hypothetical protein
MRCIATAKARIDMLSSILKYIDVDYMTDDEYNRIYELDINDEKNQREIIRRLIVPGAKAEFSEEDFKLTKEAILLSINNIESDTKIFQQMSFPFDDDIEDKKAFLQRIYHELFEEKDDN